jgi:hypothetical protein
MNSDIVYMDKVKNELNDLVSSHKIWDNPLLKSFKDKAFTMEDLRFLSIFSLFKKFY